MRIWRVEHLANHGCEGRIQTRDVMGYLVIPFSYLFLATVPLATITRI